MKKIVYGLFLLSFSVVAMHEGKKGSITSKDHELRFRTSQESLDGICKDRVSREKHKKLVALAKLARVINN